MKKKARILITLNDQGGGVMDWNYKELAATLRASMSQHQPIVILEKHERETDNGNREKIW